MRAVFVLVTILSFATPAGSWSVQRELSPLTTSSMTLASPAVPQIHRAAAKVHHPLSCGINPSVQGTGIPASSVEHVVTLTQEPPSVDRRGPPLAPRPPPAF